MKLLPFTERFQWLSKSHSPYHSLSASLVEVASEHAMKFTTFARIVRTLDASLLVMLIKV